MTNSKKPKGYTMMGWMVPDLPTSIQNPYKTKGRRTLKLYGTEVAAKTAIGLCFPKSKYNDPWKNKSAMKHREKYSPVPVYVKDKDVPTYGYEKEDQQC